jgi:pilus assembly protein CpaF
VVARCNILVSGGTGSGKTTTLGALSAFVGADERIVTIEDVAELRLVQPHVIRLEGAPGVRRGPRRGHDPAPRAQRAADAPDRIVVGEVRGARGAGHAQRDGHRHDGSLCTVHAGSPEEALRRIETLALMADVGLPHGAIREQVAGALDLVVHQSRMPDGSRRVVSVAEVVRVAGGPATRELFTTRRGRPVWRAALSDGLAARLAEAS